MEGNSDGNVVIGAPDGKDDGKMLGLMVGPCEGGVLGFKDPTREGAVLF